jgi:hypothetical protein
MAEVIFLPKVQAENARKPTEAGNPTIVPARLLLDPKVQHIFLIRNLEDAFSSYEVINSQPCGDGFWNAPKLGFHELRNLYDFVASRTADGQAPPLIVNSDDLFDRTATVVSTICKLGGIDFNDNLLKWEAKAANAEQAFGKWKGWRRLFLIANSKALLNSTL